MRVVQLTPPGSSCAIVFGTGMGPITDMVPGSVKGLHLVVEDMAVTRAALAERGIELSDVEDMGGVSTHISVIPTAICGRFSSGQPVTRHSQGAGPPRRMPTLPQSRAARRGHRAGPARTGLTQSLFIQGVPS